MKKGLIDIVVFQQSIVVNGIEKRLSELDYKVNILNWDFYLKKNYSSYCDLFIIYMPDDIAESNARQSILIDICSMVSEKGFKMLSLGEMKYHSLLSQIVPEIDDHQWLDRPVDIAVLSDTIEKMLSGEINEAEKKNILIVDDDPSYAGMVREWIKNDYKVDVVTAGMQAIKFLLNKPVDMILLDYEMPVVDGPQVLQMLRQEETTMHIPVIFLTGVGTKEAVEQVLGLHPEGYLLKTTTRENLLAYLKKKLG